MLSRALTLVLLSLAAYGRDAVTLAQVQSALRQHVGAERFAAAAWGVKAVSLDSGAVIFETNSAKLLKPASNAKLYTAALALDLFGPEYRIRTSIYARAKPDAGGALPGDLIVFGRGDPSFSARFNGGSYSNLLDPIVDQVRQAGVRVIEGDLVGDESFFHGPRLGSGWTWDDLPYYYGAEVSALTVQDNVVDLFLSPGRKTGAACLLEAKPQTDYLRFVELPVTSSSNRPASLSVERELASRTVRIRGSLPMAGEGQEEAVTVPDPALWFVTLLREELARAGIAVRGKVRTVSRPAAGSDPASLVELGGVASKPMRELIEKMLKPSQNLYAQLLLLQAGARDRSGELTEAQGIRALHAFLKKAGIDPGEVLLEEGSGLSRGGLVTPNATVALLKFMDRHPHRTIFEEALPAPGEGTLRRRLPELKGRLRAKTGTLRYVNSLSGYLTTAAGERLAFSLLLNAYHPPDEASARDDLDTVVRALASLGERTEPGAKP